MRHLSVLFSIFAAYLTQSIGWGTDNKSNNQKRCNMVNVKQVSIGMADLFLFFLLFSLSLLLLSLPMALIPPACLPYPNWTSPFINEFLMLLSVVVSSWVMLRWRHHSLSRLGFRLEPKDALFGLLLGAAMIAVGFLLQWGLGQIKVVPWHLADRGSSWEIGLLFALLCYILVAWVEEMMVRGFILGRMLDAGIHREVSWVVSSLLFSMLHFFNPDFSLLSFINIFLAGLMLGASYLYTRNLWFPVALHFSWNFAQGSIFGYEVSGTSVFPSLICQDAVDATLWNGGDFGFEGSLTCTLLLLVATASVCYAFRQRHSTIPPMK